MFSSAAVESTAANFVKSACTNPETPSNKLSSAAVDVTAVELRTSLPSPIVTLSLNVAEPASPSLGDEVTIVDYAGTFDSNTLTVGRNSSKILGADEDLTVSTERAAFTLVFTDSTQGWLFKND